MRGTVLVFKPNFKYFIFYIFSFILVICVFCVPIPVAARSRAWVCGRSLAGMVVSKPAGGMDVCVLYVCMLCVYVCVLCVCCVCVLCVYVCAVCVCVCCVFCVCMCVCCVCFVYVVCVCVCAVCMCFVCVYVCMCVYVCDVCMCVCCVCICVCAVCMCVLCVHMCVCVLCVCVLCFVCAVCMCFVCVYMCVCVVYIVCCVFCVYMCVCFVCICVCVCCVLSSTGACVGLITRPEDSYRVWCVWVCLWSLDNEEALAHWGLFSPWKGGGEFCFNGKSNKAENRDMWRTGKSYDVLFEELSRHSSRTLIISIFKSTAWQI